MTKQYPDGIYTGELLNGKKHGQGKLEYADGSYHEGIFFNDMIWTGNGTVKYSDGSVYEGELVNGEKNGEGILTYAGYFKNDRFIGTDNPDI